MNEVMNAILTRRSIRKFTADPIPAEVLEDLVKAALHAPSGMGKQTWQFTVVTNQEIIHRLCGLIGTELGREGYDMYEISSWRPALTASAPYGSTRCRTSTTVRQSAPC